MTESTVDKASPWGMWAIALMQAPGKIATLVGPLALAAIFPYERYATYEVIFSLSVLLASIAGRGYGAALPQRLIGAEDPSILWLMRKRLLISAFIAAMVCFYALNSGLLDLALATSLCQGLIAQAYGAAYLRLQERFFLSALLEHLGWIGVCGICLLIFLGPSYEPWTNLVHAVIVTSLVSTIISILILSSGRNRVGNVDERTVAAIALPFMVNHISSSSVTAAGRISLFVSGFVLESAACALAFRLAAPITFFYQIIYASQLRMLFSPVAKKAHRARYLMVRNICIASTGVSLVMSIVMSTQLSIVSRTSGLAVFLAIQTLLFWAVAEVIGLSWAGGERHLRYSLALLSSIALPLFFGVVAHRGLMQPSMVLNLTMLMTPAVLLVLVISAMSLTLDRLVGRSAQISLFLSIFVSGIFLMVLGRV